MLCGCVFINAVNTVKATIKGGRGEITSSLSVSEGAEIAHEMAYVFALRFPSQIGAVSVFRSESEEDVTQSSTESIAEIPSDQDPNVQPPQSNEAQLGDIEESFEQELRNLGYAIDPESDFQVRLGVERRSKKWNVRLLATRGEMAWLVDRVYAKRNQVLQPVSALSVREGLVVDERIRGIRNGWGWLVDSDVMEIVVPTPAVSVSEQSDQKDVELAGSESVTKEAESVEVTDEEKVSDEAVRECTGYEIRRGGLLANVERILLDCGWRIIIHPPENGNYIDWLVRSNRNYEGGIDDLLDALRLRGLFSKKNYDSRTVELWYE